MNRYISLPIYGQVITVDPDYNGQAHYLIKSPTYNNKEILVSSGIIETSASFSDSYEKTVKCNKHELAEKLVYSNGDIFTVEFEKTNKTNRVLIGYLSSTDTLLGYSTVIDVEEWTSTNDINKSKRTVYHNKLLSLIINNVKYELK